VKSRALLRTTIVYGVGDVIVLAVGGFFLLPLYTRTLSQHEFGIYVIVRANVEIFTYLLYFGLPSAAGRLYFDHRKAGRHVEYLSSILTFYLLSCGVFVCIAALWGRHIWQFLSPTTPASPYLWFSVALAAVSFLPALGTLWLRLEGRAAAFAGTQIAASVVLAAAAIVNLVLLHEGLTGLLRALLISSVCSALLLPALFGTAYRPAVKLEYITESLRYAVPVVLMYAAYFVLNRISTLILQRHAAVTDIAIFGLAQQLAAVVSIVATAFGKALQPEVFGTEPAEVMAMIRRSASLQILLMFCVTTGVVLFADEIFQFMAPASYSSGHGLLAILAIGALIYSFGQISDTALLYYRRPNLCLAVSLLGAGLSGGLSFWLIPSYQLLGASLAIAIAMLARAVAGHWLFRRQTGESYFGQMTAAAAGAAALAVLAGWLQQSSLAPACIAVIKLVIFVLAGAVAYGLYSGRRVLRLPGKDFGSLR
jgi:O-antigen/teichoic acid export membrane protein